jgi:hypothetical protein
MQSFAYFDIVQSINGSYTGSVDAGVVPAFVPSFSHSFQEWNMPRRSSFLLCISFICIAVLGTASFGGSPTPFTGNGIGGGGGIYQIAVSPYDSNYALVCSDMSGVYRSLDCGANWTMADFRQMCSTHALAPVFSSTYTYWYNSSTSKLRKSADKGITWTNVLSITNPWSGTVNNLGVISGTTDKLFVGTTSGLWQSQNAGTSWTKVSSLACNGIATVGTTRVYAAMGTTLMRSLDGGVTWTTITVSPASSNTILAVAGSQVGTSEPYLFVIANTIGVIRSTDGGTTWTTVQSWSSQAGLVMPPSQTTNVYAYSKGYSGLVWKSTSSGASGTWNSIFIWSGTSQNVNKTWLQTQLKWGFDFGNLAVSPLNPNVMFVCSQGELYKSTNGGTTWNGAMAVDVTSTKHKTIGLEVTTCWDYVWHPTDHTKQYICYTDIGFAYSTDSGATFSWGNAGNPWSNTMYEIAFDPTTPGKMFGAASSLHDIPGWSQIGNNSGSHGGVVVSTNNGTSWAQCGTGLPDEPCTDVLVDPASTAGHVTVYAAMYYSGVWKSTNGGSTWTQTTAFGRAPNLHAYHLTMDSAGSIYCLITGLQVNNVYDYRGGVWKSTNGGTTWTEITGNLFACPTGIAVVSPSIIYISESAASGQTNQACIWKTTNGGSTWTLMLSQSLAAMLAVHPQSYDNTVGVNVHPNNPNIVYCCTSTHGLWISMDAGATWQVFPNMPFKGPTRVCFNPDNSTQIVVTTFGGGLWKGFYVPFFPGDATKDGVVDGSDLNIVLSNWNASNATWAMGDFTCDGFVDGSDLNLLLSNWNAGVGSGSAGSADSTQADALPADQTAATTAQASVQTVAPAFTAQVNFQPASASTPQGYQADSGLVFGQASNGYSYGWTKDLSAFAVQRNSAASPDTRYDTAVMLVNGGTWEIALPNGMYDVKIVVGDGSGSLASQQFSVEDVPATQVSDKSIAATGWSELAVTVVVSDGRLTVTGTPGSSISFLQITGR